MKKLTAIIITIAFILSLTPLALAGEVNGYSDDRRTVSSNPDDNGNNFTESFIESTRYWWVPPDYSYPLNAEVSELNPIDVNDKGFTDHWLYQGPGGVGEPPKACFEIQVIKPDGSIRDSDTSNIEPDRDATTPRIKAIVGDTLKWIDHSQVGSGTKLTTFEAQACLLKVLPKGEKDSNDKQFYPMALSNLPSEWPEGKNYTEWNIRGTTAQQVSDAVASNIKLEDAGFLQLYLSVMDDYDCGPNGSNWSVNGDYAVKSKPGGGFPWWAYWYFATLIVEVSEGGEDYWITATGDSEYQDPAYKENPKDDDLDRIFKIKQGEEGIITLNANRAATVADTDCWLVADIDGTEYKSEKFKFGEFESLPISIPGIPCPASIIYPTVKLVTEADDPNPDNNDIIIKIVPILPAQEKCSISNQEVQGETLAEIVTEVYVDPKTGEHVGHDTEEVPLFASGNVSWYATDMRTDHYQQTWGVIGPNDREQWCLATAAQRFTVDYCGFAQRPKEMGKNLAGEYVQNYLIQKDPGLENLHRVIRSGSGVNIRGKILIEADIESYCGESSDYEGWSLEEYDQYGGGFNQSKFEDYVNQTVADLETQGITVKSTFKSQGDLVNNAEDNRMGADPGTFTGYSDTAIEQQDSFSQDYTELVEDEDHFGGSPISELKSGLSKYNSMNYLDTAFGTAREVVEPESGKFYAQRLSYGTKGSKCCDAGLVLPFYHSKHMILIDVEVSKAYGMMGDDPALSNRKYYVNLDTEDGLYGVRFVARPDFSSLTNSPYPAFECPSYTEQFAVFGSVFDDTFDDSGIIDDDDDDDGWIN